MTSLRVTQVGEYETIEIPLNIGNVLALADAKPVKPKCTCPKKNGRQAPCKGKQKPDYNEDEKRILKASADCRPKRPRDDRCAYDKYPHLKECHEKKLCSHIKCSCSTCENGRVILINSRIISLEIVY